MEKDIRVCPEMKERYLIVPLINYKSEPIEAESAEDAIVNFATTMDTDMNLYFKAIPENEYEIYMEEIRGKMHEDFVTEWMENTLIEDFDIEDECVARELAEWAYDRYCKGYGKTEYECIEWAYDNHYKDYCHDDEEEDEDWDDEEEE